MSHELTFNEVLEINELLSFKITSLIKSKSFLKTRKSQNNNELLETDIKLSAQEICDLEDLLADSSRHKGETAHRLYRVSRKLNPFTLS